MNETFRQHIETLPPKLTDLLSMSPVKVCELSLAMPSSGIYLLSESENHLYVGRSNCIRKRLQQHGRPSSDRYNATFAFRIACEETGNAAATYVHGTSRAELEKTPAVKAAFDKAKRRVREMDIRFVVEDNPIRQTLLELYVAVSLATPYNDFDTH